MPPSHGGLPFQAERKVKQSHRIKFASEKQVLSEPNGGERLIEMNCIFGFQLLPVMLAQVKNLRIAKSLRVL